MSVSTPRPLILAAGLVAVEGLVLIGLAVAEAVSISGDRLTVGLTTALFFSLFGALLVAGALALRARRSWPRGPVLIAQLIGLGLAWNFRAVPVVAAPLAVVALAVLAAMLHPASIEVLAAGPDEPDPKD